MSRRAIVTGGAGFIGSNLVDALLEGGDSVTVVDDLSTGRRENVAEQAVLAEVDICDAPSLTAAFETARPEVVFHLGAQIDVRESVADPARDLRINVGGTITVLEAARAIGAKVVFASTGGAIYGETATVPTPETETARPQAPYGQSKLSAEGYCRLYGELYGVDVTVLRLANVYGPRQDPLGEGGVVAIFCHKAHGGETGTVFGDGGQTRDFVFVGDVVAAFLAAAERSAPGPFNVGTGQEVSVNALAEALGLRTERAPERPGEVLRSCLDPARAAAELGWRAETSLEDGLARTLAWIQSP